MVVVKFISLNENNTVTMNVDGQDIVRSIPEKVESVDEYIEALAQGLKIEALEAKAPDPQTTSFSEDQVIISNGDGGGLIEG